MAYKVEFEDRVKTGERVKTIDGEKYPATMVVHVQREGKEISICLLESFPHFNPETWESLKETIDRLVEEAKRWKPMEFETNRRI